MALSVLLANPPWKRPGEYFVRAGSRWPHFERDGSRYMPFPFFMGYAAAALEKDGHTPRVVDGCAEQLSEEAFLTKCLACKPELILVETSAPSFDHDRNIVAALRRLLPRAAIALAGAWMDPDNRSLLSLAPEADYFLAGEYELSLPELAAVVQENRDPETVLSLEFRRGGEIVRNPLRPPTSDLDSIPFPARHLFFRDKYEDLVGTLPHPSLPIWGSRGCPYGCTFCVWPQLMYRGRTYRARSPENILAELRQELAAFPYRSFYFDDDTFNIGKPRMLRFCSLLREHRFGLPWAMMARADTSDFETLQAMRDAGLAVAKFGLESGVQRLVDRAEKSLDLDLACRNIRFARSIGIKVHLTFTFGIPGETRATIRETVNRALALEPDSVQFSILTPFPGSRLYKELAEQGQLTDTDLQHFDGYSRAVFRSTALPAETLERACAYARRRWMKFQAKQMLRNPELLWQKVTAKPERAWEALKQLLRGTAQETD